MQKAERENTDAGKDMAFVHSLTERLSWKLARALDTVQPPEQLVLTSLALVVGLATGAGAIVFHRLIEGLHGIFFGGADRFFFLLGPARYALLPAIGGLIVAWFIHVPLRGRRGHGVADVMESVALHGGRVRPVASLIRVLASAVTIGSGGSAGPEDPSVQIGAAIGSGVGQSLRLSDERVRTLVACGSAAGIASAFNAPISGVFFALEIVLGQYTTSAFGIVVLSAVVSAALTQAVVGRQPAFQIPPYTFVGYWEVLLYAALGVLAAVVAVAYSHSLHSIHNRFTLAPWPRMSKPVIGGLIVGIMGIAYPQIFGVGYESIGTVLSDGNMEVKLLVALVIFKILATSVTLGSGGIGGVFAPSLFLGAMLGGAFGAVVGRLFPGSVGAPPAYALVGMAAVLAGAIRAPITAIMIPFEMTQDYRIILPLMFATVISTFISDFLQKESIYVRALLSRGIRLQRGQDIDVMQGVAVWEAMTRDVDTVPANLSLKDLELVFVRSHHHGFPVLDENDELLGVVTIQDLERAKERGPIDNLRVRDIATRDVLVAYPDEPVWQALRRLGTRDVGRLPVVDRANPKRLLGAVRRYDIIHAYQRAIMRRMEEQEKTEKFRLGHLTGMRVVEIDIEPGDFAVDRRIADLPGPVSGLLITAHRDGQNIVLHGDVRLQPGDRVTAVVAHGKVEDLVRLLKSGSAGNEAESECT